MEYRLAERESKTITPKIYRPFSHAIRTAQRPFRGNRALQRFTLLTQLLLLINGRSLSQNRWMKIRASTIFLHAVSTG